MATCVFYIDEAGDPTKTEIPIINGKTPSFSLGAVAFPLDGWRDRDRQFLALKRKFFPDILDRSSRRDEYIEIKGNDLTSPRHAENDRRHAFLRATINFIKSQNGCCFGVNFIKNKDRTAPHQSLYTQGLQILVERFSLYVAESEKFDKGIIICDSRMKKFDLQVAKSHMSYIFGHRTGKTFTNILEAPLFADSRLSVGLQISDIFSSAFFTNSYYHRGLCEIEGAHDYSHMEKYWELLKEIQYHSETEVDGYKRFGYRNIDFRQEAEDR